MGTEPGAGNLSPAGRIRLGWTGRGGGHSRQVYRSETQRVTGEVSEETAVWGRGPEGWVSGAGRHGTLLRSKLPGQVCRSLHSSAILSRWERQAAKSGQRAVRRGQT